MGGGGKVCGQNGMKKLNFGTLTPSPGSGKGGGGGGRVYVQNICYHVDAFLILFNLICNMSMF